MITRYGIGATVKKIPAEACAIIGKRKSLGKSQTHHNVLKRFAIGRYIFAVSVFCVIVRNIFVKTCGIAIPFFAIVGLRGKTDTYILLVAPIFKVVPTLEARL